MFYSFLREKIAHLFIFHGGASTPLPLLAVFMALCCLGGAAARRLTRDRKVAGSTPGRGSIKSTRSTQPSIPPR